VSTATAVVANNGLHAVFAFVATLMTVMTNHITGIEGRSRSSKRRRGGADKRTIPCDVTRLAAAIADGTIQAVSCQMSGLAAIVASLLVRAVDSKMPWSVTVVAEPRFGNPLLLRSTPLR
jgi:hypothetical protein